MALEENAFILIEYTLKYNIWGKISTKSANVFLPPYIIDLFAPHSSFYGYIKCSMVTNEA